MEANSSQVTARARKSIERLGEYKTTVAQLFPALPRPCVDVWSITDADALALACFLNRYPPDSATVVLEVGTFVGVSAFHLASQLKVSEVLSVDMNPSIANEFNGYIDEMVGTHIDLEPLWNLRVLDVARTALARFPEQREKVRLLTGTVGDVGMQVSAGGAPLVAFVDAEHTEESVKTDLQTIFDKNLLTVAILHDCVAEPHAESVLAGVAGFVEGSQSAYRFGLFKELVFYPAQPNLGLLYPEVLADQVERAAAGLLVTAPACSESCK